MHLSAPFIRRPVGTSLLTLALMLSGVLALLGCSSCFSLGVDPAEPAESGTI